MQYRIEPLTSYEAGFIEDKIRACDDSIVLPEPGAQDEELVLKIVGSDGNIIGGCIASIDTWSSLEIHILWIDEQHRRQGLGSLLLRDIEQTAKEKGCRLSMLDTFSFQAKPFYEKHGYTLYGTVENWPKEHRHYYLAKRLDDPSEEYAPSGVQPEGYAVTRGSEKDGEAILEGLKEYNSSRVPLRSKYQYFEKKLADKEDNMIAGCTAEKDRADVTIVKMIWVDGPFRRQGAGSYLLREIEREVKAAGGYLMIADAFDWQVGFFTKNGYKISGMLKDFPRGHCRYKMRKEL
ncbi:MAG: GNAT family N-acetyltransferase [Clostridia bacterium]|nr:GNAT family N-acetyltransferase [Clostridia bacterium]